MILKFTVISDEIDDFSRVITIDSEATFLDFSNAILDAAGYTKDQLTSFFLCSDAWEKEQEITLIDMGNTSSEYDNLIMEETVLEDLLVEERQKMMYVFDPINDRSFFIELSEMQPNKHQTAAQCIVSKGKAPKQIVEEDVTVSVTNKYADDEDFYGDEDYDLDELDEEGFGDMNFDDSSLFSGENY